MSVEGLNEITDLPPWAVDLAREALPDYLLGRRWYPAKDRGRPELSVETWVPFSCATRICAALVVWRVVPPSGETFRLFVPIALLRRAEAGSGEVIAWMKSSESADEATHALVEAFSHDEFVRGLLRSHLGLVRDDELSPQIRIRTTDCLGGIDPTHIASWPIDRRPIEQSNTSMRVGEEVILKVFRRLTDGENPDLEVGRYLSATGFPAMPAPLGWMELAVPQGAPSTTLTLLQEFVPNQGDGWHWMLGHLQRSLVLEKRERGFETANRWLRTLAERTAELHRAFYNRRAESAFRPEPAQPEDFEAWAATAHEMAQRMFEGIAAADENVKNAGEPLLARREELFEWIERTLRHPLVFDKTRLHGDLHLGQVLVVANDVVFLDFEGEPLRPLAERRAKNSVLRDVAGVLRSIAYVAEAAVRALPATFTAAEKTSVRQILLRWRDDARVSFIDAYFSAIQGLTSVPANRTGAENLLRFFVLEKALYEVRYDLANRPSWAAIPLEGILEVLDKDSANPGGRVHELHRS
jgi:trehalose synthase-fused probable maltokinase